MRATRSIFSDEKKLSIAELSQTSPARLMLHDSAADAHEAKLFNAPRWVYRRLLQDLLAYPAALLGAGAAAAFQRELRLWRSAGTIASCWHQKLWPSAHPQWVARYAQKKKNVY